MSKHTPIFRKYHSYMVFRSGRIFSTEFNWRGHGVREMVSHPNSHGYSRVRLTVDGKRRSIFVHKLVAEIFVGPRPSAHHEVCHIDGNRLNNDAANLYWGTRKENAADRDKHGRTSRGARHSQAIKRGLHVA